MNILNENIGEKHCTSCKILKPTSDFYLNKSTNNFNNQCKECILKKCQIKYQQKSILTKDKREIDKIEKSSKLKLNNLLLDTPEAYYWIGFILADGCINHKEKTISIELSIKDKEHLLKLRNFIDVKNIRERKRHVIFNNEEKIYSLCSIQKTSLIIVQKIIEKFDLKVNKTKNPPNLNIMNDELFFSLFIGYLDGDGSITRLGKCFRCTIECHSSWFNFINSSYKRICSIFDNLKAYHVPYIKREKYVLLSIGNLKLLRDMKEKSENLNLPLLKRKWDIIFPEKIKIKTIIIKPDSPHVIKTKIIKKYLNEFPLLKPSELYRKIILNEKLKISDCQTRRIIKKLKNSTIS